VGRGGADDDAVSSVLRQDHVAEDGNALLPRRRHLPEQPVGSVAQLDVAPERAWQQQVEHAAGIQFDGHGVAGPPEERPVVGLPRGSDVAGRRHACLERLPLGQSRDRAVEERAEDADVPRVQVQPVQVQRARLRNVKGVGVNGLGLRTGCVVRLVDQPGVSRPDGQRAVLEVRAGAGGGTDVPAHRLEEHGVVHEAAAGQQHVAERLVGRRVARGPHEVAEELNEAAR